LAKAGIEPSDGSVGDRCDNPLAETINGPLQNRVGSPPKLLAQNAEPQELADLGWVDWVTNRRLPCTIGNIPSAEAEANVDAQRDGLDKVA
jgi:putative transposase